MAILFKIQRNRTFYIPLFKKPKYPEVRLKSQRLFSSQRRGFLIWGPAQSPPGTLDNHSTVRRAVPGSRREEPQAGAAAAQVLLPSTHSPHHRVTAVHACLWHPLQATSLLSWYHPRAWSQVWTLPSVFLILRLTSPKTTSSYPVNCLFEGSKRDLVHAGLHAGEQWRNIDSKPFWYFKTCLAPDPSIQGLFAVSPRIRNDETHEKQTLVPDCLRSNPGSTTY